MILEINDKLKSILLEDIDIHNVHLIKNIGDITNYLVDSDYGKAFIEIRPSQWSYNKSTGIRSMLLNYRFIFAELNDTLSLNWESSMDKTIVQIANFLQRLTTNGSLSDMNINLQSTQFNITPFSENFSVKISGWYVEVRFEYWMNNNVC